MASSAPKTYAWISLWFIFGYTVTLWDLSYILLRPYSLKGHKYRWIWGIYDMMEVIDKTYDPGYFFEGHIKSTTLSAKGALSIPEVSLAVIYLYKAHISQSPRAPLWGFTAALSTILKSALWTLEELYCGWCTVGHNTELELFRSWTAPMVMWVVFSLSTAWRLGNDIGLALEEEKGNLAKA